MKIEFVRTVDVEMHLYKRPKYVYKNIDMLDNETTVVEYKGIKAMEVVEEATNPDRVRELEATIDSEMIDEHHEYLILYIEGEEPMIFRNSHVDMFER